jgi:alkanesulfonate monooxygenase
VSAAERSDYSASVDVEGIRVYTTCPQSKDVDADQYVSRVAEVAEWSDHASCRGILVYTDNGLVDPWLVAQLIIQRTATLRPLVAVQPAYMHPYAAAKLVASLAHVHGRAVDVNLVAGGFRRDLLALGDDTAHDDRYDRLVEYGRILKELLASGEPVTFEGRYYRVRNLRMRPPLPDDCRPGLLVSGSSPAGADAARVLGATAVKYPRPPGEETGPAGDGAPSVGIRVGIIARPSDEEAWSVALERFPPDRRGQIAHRFAMEVTDSAWHHQLSAREDGHEAQPDPYWLWPFQNYRTFCPYLVGSYERVAHEVGGYLERDFRTVILDVPPSRDELDHTGVVFERALGRLAA